MVTPKSKIRDFSWETENEFSSTGDRIIYVKPKLITTDKRRYNHYGIPVTLNIRQTMQHLTIPRTKLLIPNAPILMRLRIYVAHFPIMGLYKIGRGYWKDRSSGLRKEYGETPEFVNVIYCNNDDAEFWMHWKYADKRAEFGKHKEFFHLTADDIESIKRIHSIALLSFNATEIKAHENKILAKEKKAPNDFSAILEWYNARHKAA